RPLRFHRGGFARLIDDGTRGLHRRRLPRVLSRRALSVHRRRIPLVLIGRALGVHRRRLPPVIVGGALGVHRRGARVVLRGPHRLGVFGLLRCVGGLLALIVRIASAGFRRRRGAVGKRDLIGRRRRRVPLRRSGLRRTLGIGAKRGAGCHIGDHQGAQEPPTLLAGFLAQRGLVGLHGPLGLIGSPPQPGQLPVKTLTEDGGRLVLDRRFQQRARGLLGPGRAGHTHHQARGP